VYGKALPKNDVEKEFLKYLEWITPKDQFLTFFKETVLNLWLKKGQIFEVESAKWAKRLELLEINKKHIYEMREDGSYTKDEFIERREEIENEITATKISLSESKIEQFDVESAITYATSFIRNLGRQWFDLPLHLQPRFQKLVFPDDLQYERGKGFGTAKLGCIYELNRVFNGQKSHLVAPSGIEPEF